MIDMILKYKGVEFEIELCIQPSEEDTGHPESIDYFDKIEHKGTCFLEFLEGDEDFNALVFDKYKEYYCAGI